MPIKKNIGNAFQLIWRKINKKCFFKIFHENLTYLNTLMTEYLQLFKKLILPLESNMNDSRSENK